jgi:hypothetical protein
MAEQWPLSDTCRDWRTGAFGSVPANRCLPSQASHSDTFCARLRVDTALRCGGERPGCPWHSVLTVSAP